MATQSPQTSTSIDTATSVGIVSLTVADLDRSLAFYGQTFGFTVLEHEATSAVLGVPGTPLLELVERKGARPWGGRHTGLFHFAVLVPSRADLGRWLRHWLEAGQPLPGQGDHLVSEALYLSDPDGNGIEIYRDRPRDQRRWQNGQVQMATDPVDLRGVLAEGDQAALPWQGLPAGTRVGHIHLQIGNISQAVDFYHGVLGFDVVAQMPRALFVSAGGYHHHIGLNTWHSLGAAPAPQDMAGLRHFTLDFAGAEARAETLARLAANKIAFQESAGEVVLQDPWQNTLRLRVSTASA